MNIFNGTPHAINVVEGASFQPAIRKFTGGEVVLSIPPSGTMLNAKIITMDDAPVGDIPIFKKSIEGFDPLPDGYDIYIVSALYASALLKSGADASKVYTVADPVYSNDGSAIIGCRGLCPAF